MKLRMWTTLTALAVCTLLLGSAFAQTIVPTARITAPINDSKRIAISNSTTPLVSRSVDAGRMSPTTKLGRMILMLAPSTEQEKAAAALVAAQHDPKSKLYHKWLTPAEFGQRFGVADADAAQVKAWLESNGLTVHEVANSRRFITFSGSVAGVEKAFSTQMHTYNYKGKSFVANAKDITIPAALQPVVKGVARLHSVPRVENLKIQGKATFNKINGQLSFSDGSHAMSPADFAKIYNVKPLWDAGIDGTGQKIAIVGRTDIDPNDISDFKSFFGLSNANPPQIVVNGDDPGTTGDVVEAILDVTWAGAVAPGAQVIYVESASNFDDGVDVSAAYIVDHNLAPVMSTSYGECEANLGWGNYFYYSLWQQAAAEGITAFVSSGDNGALGCTAPGSGNFGSFTFPGGDVNGLASTPYNVAVGGTQFDDTADPSQYWNPTNTYPGFSSVKGYIPEIVWNESSNDPNNVNLYATSGGASSFWDQPDWQSAPGVSDWQSFFAANNFFGFTYPGWYGGGFVPRLIPDVSLTAAGHDGYLICLERSCASGYLYYVGGTSASSPSFAGIMALINQKTGVPQGNANPTFYQMFTNEAENHTIFHDTVNGDNYVPGDAAPASYYTNYFGTPGGSSAGETGDKVFGYAATPGYDVTTGLGSVDVNALVTNWTGIGTASSTTAISGPAETAPYTHGEQLSFTVNVANSTEGGPVPTGSVALFATQSTTTPNSIVRAAINASTTTVSLGNAEIDGTGAATIYTNTIQGGTWNVWARYQGDSNVGSSVSDTVQVTVAQEGTTTLMGAIAGGYIVTGSTPLELHYGEPIPLAAVVYGDSGYGYPSGTVAIQSNGTTIGNSTLQYGENDLYCYVNCSSQSSTIFNLYSGLPVSDTPYVLTAVYGGDNSFTGSTSNEYPIKVLKGDTYLYFGVTGTIVPGFSAPLSGYVALNYSNAAALPMSGTVTIQDLTYGTTVGTATVNADGTFGTTVQFTQTGSHRLQATFSGDANTNSSLYMRSYSVVAHANTTTTLTTSASTANYGASVTLTAQVSSGVALRIPTGTVSFSDASGTLGSGVAVDGTGKAVLVTTGLTGGVHNVTATYSGDTVSATSTS
ncbi:MAG TPA: Ig-like domain repeat protein, partial [Terriglobales bacterium]